jgi:hypothetical protein
MNKREVLPIIFLFMMISCGKVKTKEECTRSTGSGEYKVTKTCEQDDAEKAAIAAKEAEKYGTPNWCSSDLQKFDNGECGSGTEFVRKTQKYCMPTNNITTNAYFCGYTYWCCRPK